MTLSDPVSFGLSDAAWQVDIISDVLRHIAAYRQNRPWSKEAGGQLYANSLTTSRVVIDRATGPYPGDRRNRCFYSMNGPAATKDREEQVHEGKILCGLWHTHPEPHPSPSSLDIKAALDNLELLEEWQSLLIIIQGTATGPEGLYVGVVHRDTTLRDLILCCNPGS